MTSMTSTVDDAEEAEQYGIQDANFYSLIAAAKIDLSFTTKERLVLMRNSSGGKEWSGEWSD